MPLEYSKDPLESLGQTGFGGFHQTSRGHKIIFSVPPANLSTRTLKWMYMNGLLRIKHFQRCHGSRKCLCPTIENQSDLWILKDPYCISMGFWTLVTLAHMHFRAPGGSYGENFTRKLFKRFRLRVLVDRFWKKRFWVSHSTDFPFWSGWSQSGRGFGRRYIMDLKGIS